MNRIDRLFKNKSGDILSIYLTAGYPELNDTPVLLKALADQGADMVEIGIPFSDPLADGPVIQQSSQIALSNGMSLEILFRQLEDIRDSVDIPLVLMGYLNPVLRMGMEAFLDRCRQCGIDGVILPDLPPDEYESRYRELFQSFGVHHALLITPYTGSDRIKRIASLSGGFLYMVSDSSTTGSKSSLRDQQLEYFQRIQEMDLPLPALIGFGISNHETFKTACDFASGAIIGSAFIKALEDNALTLEERVKRFLGMVKGDRGPEIRW